MALDFLKKIFRKKEEVIKKEENLKPKDLDKEQISTKLVEEKKEEIKVEQNMQEVKENIATKPEIKSEKTDDELAKELMEIAPELLSQAKTPEMRKMVINIYRRMLEDNVNVKDEKEVKKWLKKHPEVAQGGEPAPKVETYRRDKPKVGRNDPCPCGSGKKYKKCCGRDEK